MSLESKKVLVTGATGFIGCRLAERLALEERAIVTGTGRKLDKAPTLPEAGVQLRNVDMTDPAALRQLVEGQDIVFHLVAAMGGASGDPEIAEAINVSAVEHLVRGAAEAGVERFVHVSSVAAYGAPDREAMFEDHPLDTQQYAPYGRTKAMGELRAREVATELGLALVVIRPGMVYGPRGKSWTVNLLRLVQRRVPVIMGDGSGHAQVVYVDNLVDGLISAATRPEAAGEAFNFVDRPLPWRDLFAYYGAMSGRRPLSVPWLWLARLVLPVFIRITGRTESATDLLQFYTTKSVYPIDKARDLLDFEPRISVDEGMRRSEAWLREAGYLPPDDGWQVTVD
jgi:nucleoside-diphosphate-sugar epimerase